MADHPLAHIFDTLRSLSLKFYTQNDAQAMLLPRYWEQEQHFPGSSTFVLMGARRDSGLTLTKVFCPWAAAVLTFFLACQIQSQEHSQVLRVTADANGGARVTAGTNSVTGQRSYVVSPEPEQIGIESSKISSDRQTAGWLALYKDPNGGAAYSGALLIWRSGRVIRRFRADQVFWSWSFENNGQRVAYHVGPIHGAAPHCELRDVQSGRRIASWDGDLDNSDRPAWAKHLDH